MNDEVLWKAAGTVASVAAGVAAGDAAAYLWRRRFDTDPPANPADPDTSWGEAIGWSLLIGAFVGVARLVGRRVAAEAWRKKRGSLPPGLEKVEN